MASQADGANRRDGPDSNNAPNAFRGKYVPLIWAEADEQMIDGVL